MGESQKKNANGRFSHLQEIVSRVGDFTYPCIILSDGTLAYKQTVI